MAEKIGFNVKVDNETGALGIDVIDDKNVDYAINLLIARHVVVSLLNILHKLLVEEEKGNWTDTHDAIRHIHNQIHNIIPAGPFLEETLAIPDGARLHKILDNIVYMGAESYIFNALEGKALIGHVHRIWQEYDSVTE